MVIEDAYDLARSDDVNEFLIAGLVPKGTVILLGAFGGTGKTTFCYSMATAIASESIEWSGYPTKHGKTLIVQADEPKQDIARKLQIQRYTAKCGPGRAHFIRQWSFAQWRALEKYIIENEICFVVIDSWTATNPGLDMWKSSAGQSLYELRNVADKYGVTFIVIHHLSKDGNFRDSTTLVDNVSETWKISRPPRDSAYPRGTILMEIAKSRAGLQGNYALSQNARDYSWQFIGEVNHLDELDSDPFYTVLYKSMLDDDVETRYRAADIAQIFSISYEKAEYTLQRLWRMGQVKNEWVAIANINGESQGYFEYWVPQKVREVTA